MHTSSLLLFALGAQGAVSRSLSARTEHLFAAPGFAIAEAPLDQQLQLGSHPRPDVLSSPVRSRFGTAHRLAQRDGNTTTHTIFSGVYPVVNVTWGNKAGSAEPGQPFISYIDTGSADTFAVSRDFVCGGGKRQSECNFGRLYDTTTGNYTNITSQAFSVRYFPEMVSLDGSMVLAPIAVGTLAVPQQQVALVEAATWVGDGVASGLLGLAYPAVTSSRDRATGGPAPDYNPFFTSLVERGLPAVFTLAIDRVPRGTPYWADAGMLALGGLVPARYYEGRFTSVEIEAPQSQDDSSLRSFYATTVEVIYGSTSSLAYLTNPTNLTDPTADSPRTVSEPFQIIVDSGTAANFVPTDAAMDINSLFDPPAVFNETLNYYTVDCDATAPYVAFRIGDAEMPLDARDMIVRSLNGLPGYDEVCFSSIADGGDATEGMQIIGSTWQRSYVVAYDQGESMLHFAKRRDY